MSNIIFKLNTDNTIEIMSTDFAEQNITVMNDGDAKIIEVSAVEEDLEIIDEGDEI
tara:strand:+ start:1677 stop:1844 length:168 start_codon:yes stop_codon:yes gene_type:complete